MAITVTDIEPPRLTRSHTPHPGFADFARQNRNSRCPAYVFFTSGLLHVFAALAKTLPRHLDVRIVVSGMATEELEWLRSEYDWPVLAVDGPVDDRFVWEELARCSPTDFMWLDVDLLVHDPAVLDRLVDTVAADDVAIAGCLRHSPERLVCTPVAALSRRVLDAVAADVGPVHLGAYGWSFTGHWPLDGPPMSRRQWRLASSRLPLDDRGLPTAAQSGIYAIYNGRYHAAPGSLDGQPGMRMSNLLLDTLISYQLVALGAGYRLVATHDYPNTHRFGPDVSHIGGMSYLRRELGLPLYSGGADETASADPPQPLLPRIKQLAIETFLLDDFCGRSALPGYRRLRTDTDEMLVERRLRLSDLVERGRRLLPS